MLTLLEPSQSKWSQAQANRSAQNLLNLGKTSFKLLSNLILAPEEDELFDATDFEPPNGMRNTSGGWLTRVCYYTVMCNNLTRKRKETVLLLLIF